jgi:hypothetical protein
VEVTDNTLTATDGLILLQVPIAGEEPAEFPIIPNFTPQTEPLKKPLLIPANLLLKKQKFQKNSKLPVLETACVGNVSEHNATIATTDLEAATNITYRLIEGNYPNYKNIFPPEPPAQIIDINANYLIKLLSAFADKENGHVRMGIYPTKPDGTIAPIVIKNSIGYVGLCMPLKNI